MFLVSPYSYPPGTMLSAIQRIGLTSGLKLCFDAGDIDSYDGSSTQTWRDVSGNGTHATNGISSGNTTNDWSYNGTPGNQTSSEFWRSNSSVFRVTLQSWMQTLHKSGAIATIAGWARSDTSYAGFHADTMDENSVIGGVAYPGISFGVSNGLNGTTLGAPSIDIRRSDGQLAKVIVGTLVVPSGWAFTAIAWDEAANSATVQVNGTQQTVTASYSSPSSGSATRDMIINRSAPGGTSDIAAVMIWTTKLAADDLMALYNSTKGKFGL